MLFAFLSTETFLQRSGGAGGFGQLTQLRRIGKFVMCIWPCNGRTFSDRNRVFGSLQSYLERFDNCC